MQFWENVDDCQNVFLARDLKTTRLNIKKSDNILKNLEYNVDCTFLEERQCCCFLTCAGLLLRQVKGAVRSLFNSSIEKPFGHLQKHGNKINLTTFLESWSI